MRCPNCGETEDRVVDSRSVEHGAAVRRRRQCLRCGQRFSTFERVVGSVVFVEKRSGEREPFRRSKVISGIQAACKNRPVDPGAIDRLADEVELRVRELGPEVSSEQVGMAVLDRLREVDDVAYLRFASVYKGFEDAVDFAREVGLLSKTTAPKHHERQ